MPLLEELNLSTTPESDWQIYIQNGDNSAEFRTTLSSAILTALGSTGSGVLVRAQSPTLITPVLGVATVTSVNKVAITAPATSATLTIADGATLTASASATVSGTNTGDQTITLTGNVTGSGTGSFATTIGAGVVTNSMLAGSIAYSKLSLTGAILNADLAGSIALSKLSITGTPDGTKFLRDDGAWATVFTVPGSDTQVLFNSSSALGASANFTFNSGTRILTVDGGVVINEGGGDYDFRVETDNSAFGFFVDASADTVSLSGVLIAGSGPTTITNATGKVLIAALDITGTPTGTKFLRDDGSWATPGGVGGGTVTSVAVATADGISGSVDDPNGDAEITITIGAGAITNTQLAGSIAYSKLNLTGAILNADLAGSIALSKLSITGTPDGSKFLRDDGSWQTVSGGTITVADTQVLFADGANNPAGDSGLTFDKTTNILTATGGMLRPNSAAGSENNAFLLTSDSSNTYFAAWFGSAVTSPTLSNYSWLYSNNTAPGFIFNAPAGQSLSFRYNNSDVLVLGTAGVTLSNSLQSTYAAVFTPTNASTVPVRVQAAASQSANLLNFLASDGTTVLASVSATGAISAPSLTANHGGGLFGAPGGTLYVANTNNGHVYIQWGNGGELQGVWNAGLVLNRSLTTTIGAIGTTSTDGSVLQNTTAAAAGAQQYSPRLVFTGQGWKTDATAASQSVSFAMEVRPVQGAASPSGALHFGYSINGGGYVMPLSLDSNGRLFNFVQNTAPGRAGYFVYEVTSATNTSGSQGIFAEVDLKGSVNYSGNTQAVDINAQALSSGTVGNIHSINGYTYNSSATTVTLLNGCQMYVQSDAGTTTTAQGYFTHLDVNNTATVSTWYGYRVGTLTKDAGATLTTAYHFYVASQTIGTTRWAYYSVNTPSFFGGAVTAQAEASGAIPLIAKGASGQSVSLQEWRTDGDAVVASISAAGNLHAAGVITAGSSPTTLTSSAGKVLIAALNTTGTPDGSKFLRDDGQWTTVSGGTITGTDTHVLFFDGANNPAGDAGLTYNKTTDTLTAGDFAGSGASLTALNASNLGSGTVPDARFPATLPAASGANLTSLNGSNISSGTVAVARLGSGTPSAANFLRGDGAWSTPGSANIVLGENIGVALNPAGSADGKWSGITITGTAGYTQAFGDLVYLDPTDSRWEATDANSAAAADGDARGVLGMVVSAGTDGTACTILLQGVIRADAKFPSFTINNPIYVSETAGLVTQTQPTTTDAVIRIVGQALTADELYFNPDCLWITRV